MNAQLFNQYRPVSYLVLMQSTVVGFGTLATAAMMKLWKEAVEGGYAVYNPASLFARDFGALLLLIPAAWAALVVYRIRTQKDDSLHTFLGVCLLVLLSIFFGCTAIGAARFHVLSTTL
jgi:hypothetical protein